MTLSSSFLALTPPLCRPGTLKQSGVLAQNPGPREEPLHTREKARGPQRGAACPRLHSRQGGARSGCWGGRPQTGDTPRSLRVHFRGLLLVLAPKGLLAPWFHQSPPPASKVGGPSPEHPSPRHQLAWLSWPRRPQLGHASSPDPPLKDTKASTPESVPLYDCSVSSSPRRFPLVL